MTGQTSFDETRPVELESSSMQGQPRSTRASFDRSPQKGGSDINNRSSRIQELIGKLHKEEKIRDAAGAMLADLIFGQGQQHKHHGNMIKQLNNLNNFKADSQHKKKVKAQFDAAEREVQSIMEELRELGIDEDDEISSGDEDGGGGGSASILFSDDYGFVDEENKMASLAGILSSSAASSSVDLANMTSTMGSRENEQANSPGMKSFILSAENAVKHIILVLEALEPSSSEAQVAVDKISELILTIPSVASELRAQAPWETACITAKPFLLSKDPHILGLGLRLLRAFMIDIDAFNFFTSALSLDVILVQILSKDDHDKNHQLRLHATQLIRAIVNISGGGSHLHQGTYRALVAVAEQSRDDIRHICIETLAELMVIEPEKVFEAGGIKVMLNAMNESSDGTESNAHEENNAFSLAVAMAFTGAADCPMLRRKYLRDGRDLSALLTHFTDAPLYGISKPNKHQLHASATVIQSFLRSWVGLSCFDLDLFVQCMTVPIQEIQDTLLNVLDNILWIPKTQNSLSHTETSAKNAELLSHQFTAILLSRLQRCGLQEKLVTLQTEGVTGNIRVKAQYVGSKIFVLSSKLIPQHAVVNKSMVIPEHLSSNLVKASPYSLPTASVALFGAEAELQQLTAIQAKPDLHAFIRFGLAMDDASFKRLVNMTHVLDTKMFRQWNWDALMELVQGPLRSPRRFDEVSRGSKFLKRLLSFYRPFKYRFSNLTITRDHLRYIEVGKELMQSLLETSEGVRYLSQNKLFRQIAECLAQLDPLSGIMSNEPLFSVRRFRSTLCGAYSELIGALSHSIVGQQILAQIRIFNMFYRVCDINREDVVRSIICSLDYRMEGHPRLILAKALTASSKTTRLYATEFVGIQLATEEAQLWAVDLMIEQLYDTEISVANAAAAGLHNMCEASGQVLDYLISIKPFLGHIGEAAEPLRILFMSRPQGFELVLSDMESRNMNVWAPEFNAAYVENIEMYLESVNFLRMGQPASKYDQEISTGKITPEPFKFPTYSRPPKKHYQGAKISPPAHFYGEMASTDQGCRFLKSKAAITNLSLIIEGAARSPNKCLSPEEIREIKGALWAIGHVASREKGALLLNMSITENICSICKNSEVYSLRGTAFYCLGLFALSFSGAEYLHQCGWEVVYDVYSKPVGVTLPPESYYQNTDDALERRKDRISRIAFPPRIAEHEKLSELHLSPETSNKPRTSPSNVSPKFRLNQSVSKTNLSTSAHGNMPPHLNSSNRLRAPSLDDGDKSHVQPVNLLPSAISSSSLMMSPTSAVYKNNFDFEVDPDISSRRSSCFDLLEVRKDGTIGLVLKSISELGSYVLASTASRKLIALRASHPDIFQSGDVLKQVAAILASGHYKQVTRKFVFELFDMQSCLEKLIKCARVSP